MHALTSINTAIAEEGGAPYFVGGCVRDDILGIQPKDYDIEVFNMGPDTLKGILSKFGTVNEVGKSFGVLILNLADGTKTEFTIPRRENKEGRGHKGFLVELDPTMSIKEAAKRRDFTINAMYKHALDREGPIIDPWGGRADLAVGLLRPVSEHFGEDPLRVLRGMQFAARFQMRASRTCRDLSKTIFHEYNSLPSDRVWGEWYKWATQSVEPSLGIEFLCNTGWVDHYTDITAMIGVEQNPAWHPEGDVFLHVMHVCNAAAMIAERDHLMGEDRAVLLFAAFCHDMGKPSTTVFERDAWRSPGHDSAGVPIARRFLESIGCLERIIVRVLPLIAEHMFPVWTTINKRMVRRLKLRLEPSTVDELLQLMEADHSGRPPLPKGLPSGAARLIELNQDLPPKIEPVVTGRHIMDLGIKDGKTIGEIKRRVFDAQVEETFDVSNLVEALAYTHNLIITEYSHAITSTDD